MTKIPSLTKGLADLEELGKSLQKKIKIENKQSKSATAARDKAEALRSTVIDAEKEYSEVTDRISFVKAKLDEINQKIAQHGEMTKIIEDKKLRQDWNTRKNH